MKILLLGKNGMLGYDLKKVFDEKKQTWFNSEIQIISLGSFELDITDNKAVQETIEAIKPTLVINAAAMTNVDACEDDEKKAYLLNADAVGFLAMATKKIGATLAHYSTDYVFDGNFQEGYKEDDAPNPVSVYGASKLKGEINALSENPNTVIFRICWLYGENRANFVDFLIKAAKEKTGIKLLSDQYGHPSSTHDLALASASHLLNKLKPLNRGIYHLFNEGVASRAQQGEYIFEILGQKPPIEYVTIDAFPGKAKRPRYSILKNTKLPDLRNWKNALKEYVENKSK